MLPTEVITEDRRLEREAEKLAQHRWHWTLDESNPDRVSFTEYARAIGRDESRVRKMASGYALWLDENTTGARADSDISDSIARAGMSAETHAVAKAVAKARGIGTQTTQDGRHQQEVRRVREISRQLAEEHGTSIEEEAPKVAETIVAHERATQEEKQEKAERTDFRVIEAERHTLTAKRAVSKAIKALEQVELDDDAIEILKDAFNGLKMACTLFDVRLSGKSGVDWDAELARLA